MTTIDEVTIEVASDVDVVLAGRQAKTLLATLELEESVIEEVALVVQELASNIVKHADGGEITVSRKSADGRTGIEVHARDSGPGIENVSQAIVDGYSTVGSLGGGLGAVHRLMDDVVIDSDGEPGAGVGIVATRWTGESSTDPGTPPLVTGAATRPKAGLEKNGDAFLIEHGSGHSLVGVIDGLGHGRAAHLASTTAQQFVRTHATEPLAALFEGVERACQDTRGVVMALARFEWEADEVSLGSVGNVTVRVCRPSRSKSLASVRGVLGDDAPSPLLETWDWHREEVMVVHSDGLSSRWECDRVLQPGSRSAADTANEMLRSFSTVDDDATVLVIQGSDS